MRDVLNMNHNNSSRLTSLTTKIESEINDEEFEVECLLDHKCYYKNRLKFLVKWKGYDESHSEWAKQKDLKCPSILQNYI